MNMNMCWGNFIDKCNGISRIMLLISSAVSQMSLRYVREFCKVKDDVSLDILGYTNK